MPAFLVCDPLEVKNPERNNSAIISVYTAGHQIIVSELAVFSDSRFANHRFTFLKFDKEIGGKFLITVLR